MQIETANKILIIRFSSLGDVVLTTPVIRALKEKFPGKEFDFLVLESFSEAVSNNPNLTDVYTYNKNNNLNDLIEKLKNNGYDFIIDLQNNFRSRKVCRGLNVPYVKYKKPSLKKLLYVKFKYPVLKEISIPERYISELNSIKLDNKGPEYYLPKDYKSEIKVQKNTVSLCPGSKHFTKQWPEEYYLELSEILLSDGYNVALLGGKDDKEICERIAKKNRRIADYSGENDLTKIAYLMKNSLVAVCNDSGLMHLATAVEVPVFVFFGSTVTNFGFKPYNSKHLILENTNLKCRPCSHIGRDSCPKNHFGCMRSLTPELAYRKLKEFILTLDLKKN